MKYDLFTDGAARGNPGLGGAGVYVRDEKGVEVFKFGKFLGHVTNNVAEYQALLLGLKELKKRKILQLRIYADSELMVRQIKGQYRVRNEQLKKIYDQVMEMLIEFEYKIFHIDREKNKFADQLANEAIDERLDEMS